MTFRIYTGTPTIAIWTSTTRSVTPNNGLFTVYLGDQPSFDPSLPFDTLAQAASIGVTVGSDAEMTPRQALRSVVGHSLNEVGVVGSSDTGFGVFGSSNSLSGVKGSSDTGTGVNGSSQSSTGVVGSSDSGVGVGAFSNTSYGVLGRSISGDGVVGQTFEATRAAVLAKAAGNSGIALEIFSGGIKATGAGGGTSTFAFVHVSSAANTPSNGPYTLISNTLTNNDQTAMLFVTHVFNPPGVTPNSFQHTFGVFYDTSNSKWSIYTEDLVNAIPPGTTFNVMVIKR